MTLKVAIRADASLLLASGHIMRCLTLAHALKQQGAQCIFICRTHEGHLNSLINAQGFTVLELQSPVSLPEKNVSVDTRLGVSWQEDALDTQEVLQQYSPDWAVPDWLVVDHYALGSDWESAFRNTGSRVLVIDDMKDRSHAGNMLLNQNAGVEREDYLKLVPAGCLLLTGPEFALLRPEFSRSLAETSAQQDTDKRQQFGLVVSMGGMDPPAATVWVLKYLMNHPLPIHWKLTVIMGSLSPHLNEVKRLLPQLPCKTELLVDSNDMATVLHRAHLAIAASGASSWERCAVGLPSIAIAIAENQLPICQVLEAKGAAIAVSLGDDDALQVAMRTCIEQPDLLEKMSAAASTLVDGFGTERVVQMMKTCVELNLREIDISDTRSIWDVRSSHADNRIFRNAREQHYAGHVTWMKHAVADPKVLFYIIEADADAEVVGYVRFSDVGDTWLTSICLHASALGKGFGQRALSGAIKLAQERGIESFEAQIHMSNLPSMRLFESAGYVSRGIDEEGFHLLTRTTCDAKNSENLACQT